MIWWNLVAVVLIIFIIWWFWLWKPKSAVEVRDKAIDIIVDNGIYDPAAIESTIGTTITLRFLRKDQTPCSSTVVFDDFGVSAELPVNQKQDVVLTLTKSGEFEFTCQMGMYRGKLIVR